MVKNPVVVSPYVSVKEVAEIMKEKEIASVILVRNDKAVGIVTERDLVHRVMASGKDPNSISALDVCSKPVVSIYEHGDVEVAVDTMNDYNIRRIVVTDRDDMVVGILTTDDIGFGLRSMSEDLAIKYLIATGRRNNKKDE
jgi:CBS domain-containing protein